MENLISYILGFGLLGIMISFLVIVLLCKFFIFLIKCGTKNAIIEILDDEQYTKDLKYTIAEGVLLALEQYNNGNQKKDVDE